jgi:hypothetical protein
MNEMGEEERREFLAWYEPEIRGAYFRQQARLKNTAKMTSRS